MRILVVEDDALVADAILRGLEKAGYAVDRVDSAERAATALDAESFDLAVVDIGLPGADGLALLQRMRRGGVALPVLILTARDGLDDRVAGLDAGADDYVTKPFDLPELAARVRALARRRAGQAQPTIEVGPLVFDTIGREVRVNGQRLALSVRELSVLEMLMARVGRVVTKRQIVNSLSAWDADFSENAVEVYVYRLRKRLEGTGASIQTVRGFGYLLDVESA